MPKNSKKKTSLKKRLLARYSKVQTYIIGKSPHRSFQRTKRRDYIRPLVLPNPLGFLYEVTVTMWAYRRLFIPLMAVYLVLYVGLVGIASQETYSTLAGSFEQQAVEVGVAPGNVFEQASLSLLSIGTGGLTGSLTDAQQIFAVILALLAWLTTVWLLRNVLAGNKIKMRDALYNAGSPIIATIVVTAIILLQLIPVGIAALGYIAASTSGLIAAGGIEVMLFWAAAGLLVLLSLYWVSSSLFAMIIVTLPGMYPIRALRASRDILMGRKLKFLLRFIWMFIFILAVWVVILIPIILLDGWLKSVAPAINWLPIVPAFVVIVGTFSVFWMSTYIYLLYRKVVDHE